MSVTNSAEAVLAAKDSMVRNANQITAAVESVSKICGPTISSIGQVTSVLEKALGVSSRFSVAISAVGLAVTSMGTSFKGLQSLPEILTKLSTGASKLTDMAATVASTVAEKAHAFAVAASNEVLNDQAKALNANIIAKTKETVTSVAQTVAEKARAIAVGISTGQISLQTIATNALAVATGVLSAAFTLLKGPIGWFIGIVSVVAAGVMAIIYAVNKSNAAFNAAGETIEEYKEKNEELEDGIKESTDSYRKNDAAAQGNAATIRNMANAVKQAAADYDGTAESAVKMQAKVRMLNEACDGLNLTFDESTGVLSQTSGEIDAYIAASEQAARKTALGDHMTELNQKMADTQAEMIKAEMEIEKWGQQVAAGEMSESQFIDRKREMETTIGELSTTVGETSEEMAQYEQKLTEIQVAEDAARQDLMKQQEESIRALAGEYHYSYEDIIADMEAQNIGFSEWTVENLAMLQENKAAVEGYAAQWGVSADEIMACCEAQGVTFQELADTQQAAIDRLKGLYGSLADSATEMFDRIETNSETSIEDMTANLAHNQEAVAQWSENIAALAALGIDDGLLQTLMEAGPEAAGYVQSIVNGSEEEIMKLSEVYAAGAGTANQALKTTLGDADITPEIMRLVAQTEESLYQQVEDADFMGIGRSVGEGYAQGISDTEDLILAGSRQIAQTTSGTVEDALQINSPSKVFSDIGANVDQGMAQGLTEHLSVIKTAADGIVQTLDIGSALYTSGQNAMQGFNNGLSGTAYKVYATARTIAENVANTINNALGVRSPSRLLRETGQYTMEGFNLGMQDRKKELFRTVRGIADTVSAEMRDAATSAGSIDAVYSYQTNVHDSTTTGLLEKLLSAVQDGKVIRMDTGALVGATSGAYDLSLGKTKLYNERWRR